MRRKFKWAGIIFAVPIGLLLLVAVSLYIPPVQNYVLKKATYYAGKASGMTIGIDRIRLTFPLNLTVEGVEIIAGQADTLASLQELSIRVNPVPLLRQEISIRFLQLKEVRFNTGALVEGMSLQGSIDGLSAQANQIALTDEKATLNNFYLNGAVVTLRIDSITQPKDTVPTPLNWKIDLGKINLEHICFALQMPEDSLRISTYVGQAEAEEGRIDLGISKYTLDKFSLKNTVLNYDGDDKEPSSGLDPLHMVISNLQADIRSIVYQDKEIQADIRSVSAEERSGLVISSFAGKINSDSTLISIPDLQLETPVSKFNATAHIPWSMLEGSSEEELQVRIAASVGGKDLFILMPGLPADFKKSYPAVPLVFTAKAQGNLKELALQEFKVEWPGALSLKASGKAGELTDSILRSADIHLQAQTHNLDFALSYLPAEQRETYFLPPVRLEGDFSLKNREYQTQFHFKEAEADILVAARFHSLYETYSASVQINELQPVHFMPKDSILSVSASLEAEGRGLDIFADSTWTSVKMDIRHIEYDSLLLSDMSLMASLKEHQAKVEFVSKDTLALLNLSIDGTLRKGEAHGMMIMDAEKIDLYGMHLIDSTFNTSFQVFAEISSDLKENNNLDLSLGNWEIITKRQAYKSKLLTLRAHTTPDTSRVSFHAGDFGIILTGNAGLDTIVNKVSLFTLALNNQLAADSTIDIAALRPVLPDMSLSVTAGKDNPIYNFLRPYYIGFTQFHALAETSSEKGIRIDAGIYSLYRDTFLLDTLRATVRPDPAGLTYTATAIKKRYRQQSPFTAHVSGTIRNRYADAELIYKNERDETGLLIGLQARKDSAGFICRLSPEEPVFAFSRFTLNPDNYFRFKSIKEMEADIRFTGNNHAMLWIHSMEQTGAYPELNFELSQFNLDSITSGFPLLPHLKGMLGANIRYAPMEETFMLVADVNIDDLYYENGRIGEILLNTVYLPLENNEHQVDAHMYRDQQEVMAATTLYRAGNKQESIDGQLDIIDFPLPIVSPFTEGMADLNGTLSGSLAIDGSSSSPRLNGYIALDSASAYINRANTRIRFEEKKIEVKNNLVSFDKYQILSSGKNPFIIDGNIDISTFSRMTADLKLSAVNMQALDAKRTKESLVYGKLFMNLTSTVKGPLNALDVKGDLQLLGGTNLTYIMTESALTVQDRLKDLVTFTSFTDTLTRSRRLQNAQSLGGMDVLMVIHIDPVVRLRVDLSPDQSNYATIIGGGDLSFQYTPQGDMILNGRYTFSEGIINYSLPVIPLKEFHVKEDSYIQWNGDVMNPLLDIRATERMRVSAKTMGETSPRMVNFDVGISIRDRLDEMQLGFTIAAPEDMAIQNELASLDAEERSKQAVALMATGAYLYGGGSGGMNLSASDALNSFINSEINHIVGDALKTVDVNFGMDTYDDPSGSQRRDFSFQFAKRFYNDRIRVVVGGKVSTGNNIEQDNSFFDNVSVEYRIDPSGSKNVKLFHDVTYDNLLEGQVRETGAGIVFRKKVRWLREMFDFRKKKTEAVNEQQPHDE